VWDLDNTLWDGVLLEDGEVRLRQAVVDVIQALDARGILNSIASRNDPGTAMQQLQRYGITEYFLYPQVGWNSKAVSIKTIAERLNIGIDTIAFVDDQPFELEEVAFELPEVLCIDASDVQQLLQRPETNPRFITSESAQRRVTYLTDAQRSQAECEFVGSSDEFLAGLNMVFSIADAHEDDLRRVEELTVRTNQLNTTARTYSYEQLDAFRQSEDHQLLVAGLEDRFGSYGKIGLALVERAPGVWTIKLLLMSCRVMSRGVGNILISHLMAHAQRAGVRLLAEFIPNERNRMMLITYRFAGFAEVGRDGDVLIFEADLSRIQRPPAYIRVEAISTAA
jgi:FkbH-like protein